MANDTFNGSTPQEAADEIFGVINVVSGVAYNSDERTLSGVVDDLADDQYLKVGWRGFYTDGIKCDIDSAETRAIASAKEYTDNAIANITGISIEGLSGASGVSYNSTNKIISGRVDNVANEGGYLKVGGGGFYVSGINSAIDAAKQEAISESIGAIGAKNGVKVTEQDGVKTVEGVVDGSQPEKFLKVGGNGFYTTGISETIDAAKQDAISASTAYTNQEITNVQENVNSTISGITNQITVINQNIEAISGETSGLTAGSGVAMSNHTIVGVVDPSSEGGYLTVGENGFKVSGIKADIADAIVSGISGIESVLMLRGTVTAGTQARPGTITETDGFKIGYTYLVENNGYIEGESKEVEAGDMFICTGVNGGVPEWSVIQTNITADDMVDTAVTYSRLTTNEQRPILVKKETGAGSGTGNVQFTSGLTVNNAGDLSGHSISSQTLVVTSGITANNLTTTSITYSGTELTEYIENTVTSITEDHDEKVEQVRYTGTAAKPIIVNTNGAENTGKVGFVSAVTVDGNGGLSAVSASIDSIASDSITTTNLSANNFSATAITYNGQSLDQYISQTAGDKNVQQVPILSPVSGATTVPIITREPTAPTSATTGGVAYASGAVVVLDANARAKISANTIEGLTVTGTTVLGDTIKSGATNLSDLFVTSDSAVTQTSFTGTGSAYMVLHTGTSSSTTGVSYVTGVSSDNAGNLKSASVSAGTITAATSMVTSAMTTNTISAGTNSAETAVTVTGVVEATKFVGIIDCGTYSGASNN